MAVLRNVGNCESLEDGPVLGYTVGAIVGMTEGREEGNEVGPAEAVGVWEGDTVGPILG